MYTGGIRKEIRRIDRHPRHTRHTRQGHLALPFLADEALHLTCVQFAIPLAIELFAPRPSSKH